MKIVLMAFGSRGDIQPFLGLALALQKRGHEVTLAAPNDFTELAASYHIPYRATPLSTQEIMQQDFAQDFMQKGMTPRASFKLLRGILPELRRIVYSTTEIVAEEAKDADLLISHGFLLPSAYTLHQSLKIPVILGLAAPIIRTKHKPAVFPAIPIGSGIYHPMYDLIPRMIFAFMVGPTNRYRQELGLPKERMGNLLRYFNQTFPFILHYSRHLFPTPPDWDTNIHVHGAWTLPSPADWTAPEALTKFLAEGDAPIYFGFGSMPVPNAEKFLKNVSAALRETGLRGLIQAGWAGLSHQDENLMTIGDAPHDWLFPRMAAIVHHGGAGTTHSAARAGKAALIVPFSGDQPFWGRRLAELGIAVPPIVLKNLSKERLVEALRRFRDDSELRQRAEAMGALLRAEDGLGLSAAFIEKLSINRQGS